MDSMQLFFFFFLFFFLRLFLTRVLTPGSQGRKHLVRCTLQNVCFMILNAVTCRYFPVRPEHPGIQKNLRSGITFDLLLDLNSFVSEGVGVGGN